jgi:predicted phage-related endonuclease
MGQIERIERDDEAMWLADRLRYVNASEMGVVCGEGGYGSLAELYAEKKGLTAKGAANAAMQRGDWGQPAVFKAIARTFPEWRLVEANIHLRDNENRIAATPDGFVLMPDRDGMGVVEAKVIARSIFRRKYLLDPEDDIIFGDATVPMAFRLQLQANMRLSECEWGIIAVLIVAEHTWDLRIFEFEHDPVLEDKILFHTAEFFRNYFDPEIMPPFQPQRDEDLVKYLYPRDDGSEIDLSRDNRALALVDAFIETDASIKRMEKVCKEIKTELQAKLGEHTYGKLTHGRRLSWKLQHRKAHTVPASDFRVFKILKPERKEIVR